MAGMHPAFQAVLFYSVLMVITNQSPSYPLSKDIHNLLDWYRLRPSSLAPLKVAFSQAPAPGNSQITTFRLPGIRPQTLAIGTFAGTEAHMQWGDFASSFSMLALTTLPAEAGVIEVSSLREIAATAGRKVDTAAFRDQLALWKFNGHTQSSYPRRDGPVYASAEDSFHLVDPYTRRRMFPASEQARLLEVLARPPAEAEATPVVTIDYGLLHRLLPLGLLRSEALALTGSPAAALLTLSGSPMLRLLLRRAPAVPRLCLKPGPDGRPSVVEDATGPGLDPVLPVAEAAAFLVSDMGPLSMEGLGQEHELAAARVARAGRQAMQAFDLYVLFMREGAPGGDFGAFLAAARRLEDEHRLANMRQELAEVSDAGTGFQLDVATPRSARPMANLRAAFQMDSLYRDMERTKGDFAAALQALEHPDAGEAADSAVAPGTAGPVSGGGLARGLERLQALAPGAAVDSPEFRAAFEQELRQSLVALAQEELARANDQYHRQVQAHARALQAVEDCFFADRAEGYLLRYGMTAFPTVSFGMLTAPIIRPDTLRRWNPLDYLVALRSSTTEDGFTPLQSSTERRVSETLHACVPELYRVLAIIRLQEGEWLEALAYAGRALEMLPDKYISPSLNPYVLDVDDERFARGTLLALRAACLLKLGLHQEALEEANKVLTELRTSLLTPAVIRSLSTYQQDVMPTPPAEPDEEAIYFPAAAGLPQNAPVVHNFSDARALCNAFAVAGEVLFSSQQYPEALASLRFAIALQRILPNNASFLTPGFGGDASLRHLEAPYFRCNRENIHAQRSPMAGPRAAAAAAAAAPTPTATGPPAPPPPRA
ncbi:hypothetical protein H696_04314 [Fonticula alba]|uniref:Uncharacterized protein n=1 Tax=Fonticula alba TaxID=691883 RepID=A0A058Z3R1_FONAL|nr:hypothetical protein H696_04314 [Fonticula alba]KCV68895.1 hypothetical protein H696_04314 [Fonticula alba]|eukprot:XP_009496466.1 hypothetical protein H696_04314 [Fonticula alba]